MHRRERITRRGTATAVGWLIALAALAAEPEPGPIRVGDRYILGAGFLNLDPVSAESLECDQWRVEVLLSAGNTFATSGAVELALEARDSRGPVTTSFLDELAKGRSEGDLLYLDGELHETRLVLSRGLGRGVEVGLSVPVLRFGGGTLDGPIEVFHDAFSLGQAGREGATKDRLLLFVSGDRGRLVVEETPGTVIGDVVLEAKMAFRRATDRRWKLALRTAVKVPTGGDEPVVSSGATDVGVEFVWSRRARRWSLHGSAGATHLGASDGLGLESQTLFSTGISLERRLGRLTHGLVQVEVSESPFEDLRTSRIGRVGFQTTLGLKRALTERSELVVAATENLQNFNNSSDLTLHLGVRHRVR